MADEQGRDPVEIVVTREAGWWLGLPTSHPGSCIGATVAELMDEAWRIMPYMADLDPAAMELVYTFTDVPADVLAIVAEHERSVDH
ncbi:hypothetical protein [Actinomadura sp. 6N118]|uniref:hypothetical protein n=1 Tax=Actinomadura sp. 6N118 TaxID=3375151 RepID=UPI0037B4FCE3